MYCKKFGTVSAALIATILVSFSTVSSAVAATREQIDLRVTAALADFEQDIGGASELLEKAVGVLVFPRIYKAGFKFGVEYGEGALLVGGKVVDYYNTAGLSIGLQAGIQTKSVVLAFMSKSALNRFRKSWGWEAGIDGSVALINIGAGKDLNTSNITAPVIGVVFANTGLMINATIEGSKITKLSKG